MDSRYPVLSLFLVLCLLVLSAGCASAPVQDSTTAPVSTPIHPAENPGGTTSATQKESIAEQLAPVRSDNPVWSSA